MGNEATLTQPLLSLIPKPPDSEIAQPTMPAIRMYSTGDKVLIRSHQMNTLVPATVFEFKDDNTMKVHYKIDKTTYAKWIRDANKPENVRRHEAAAPQRPSSGPTTAS